MEGDRKVYQNSQLLGASRVLPPPGEAFVVKSGYAWRWYIGTLAELLGIETDELTRNVVHS
jgi:hypothetical protein